MCGAFFWLTLALLCTEEKPLTEPVSLLSQTVVVLDAGHGGRDTSAFGYHARFNAKVWEPEYVYDVGLRVREILERGQALVVPTTSDSRHLQPSNKRILPKDKNERFTLTGEVAHNGREGLLTRMRTANIAAYRYRRQTLFVSLHLDDYRPKKKSDNWDGAYIIVPAVGEVPSLAFYLAEEFREAGLLRQNTLLGEERRPIVRNGDNITYARILRGREDADGSEWNRIEQRVLVELGNLGNAVDVERITDPAVRQLYAETIARAIERYVRSQIPPLPFWVAYREGLSSKPGAWL